MRQPDRSRCRALSRLVPVIGGLLSAACGDDSTGGGGGGGAPPGSTTAASVAASTTVATVAPASSAAGDGGGGGAGGAGSGGEGGVATSICADESVCEGSLCSLDPPSGAWSCVAPGDCQEERRCGGECCPTGSRCDDGACLLPNLSIHEARLRDSVEVQARTFGANACEIVEGCVDAPGQRRLLRFDLKTPNDGEGDLFLGDPDDNQDLFEYSSCHDHHHFTTYAAYRLLDGDGQVAATGHKQAFCLLDFEREPGGSPNAVYSCGYQGIQRSWSDIYDSYLPCQWVDITDVPPGDYLLEIRLNTDHVLIESDYDDNDLTVPVTIEAESCPAGCPAWDEDVCQPGDPEGRAGDGACDCAGIFEWDAADCASCSACRAVSCPGGCATPPDGCCGDEDACDLSGNDVCECPAAEWDEVDCGLCISADDDCAPVDSCPRGCGFSGNQCNGFDEESIADGWCDCTDQGWDTIDCFSCTSNCGQD